MISSLELPPSSSSSSFPPAGFLPPGGDEFLERAASEVKIRLSALLLSPSSSGGVPMANLSYGFLAGYASGYSLKKVGRLACAALGLSFLGLQALSRLGYVDVRHDRLKEAVEGLLDRNGDGIVDAEDLRECAEGARRIAGFGIVDDDRGKKDGKGGGGEGGGAVGDGGAYASAGGFGLGFYGGLRYG